MDSSSEKDTFSENEEVEDQSIKNNLKHPVLSEDKEEDEAVS